MPEPTYGQINPENEVEPSAPNAIAAKGEGEVSIPNAIAANPAGSVAAPNALTPQPKAVVPTLEESQIVPEG